VFLLWSHVIAATLRHGRVPAVGQRGSSPEPCRVHLSTHLRRSETLGELCVLRTLRQISHGGFRHPRGEADTRRGHSPAALSLQIRVQTGWGWSWKSPQTAECSLALVGGILDGTERCGQAGARRTLILMDNYCLEITSRPHLHQPPPWRPGAICTLSVI